MKSKQRKQLAICAIAVIIVWTVIGTVSCYVEEVNVNLTPQDNNQTSK
jgi:hypothetical protein